MCLPSPYIALLLCDPFLLDIQLWADYVILVGFGPILFQPKVRKFKPGPIFYTLKTSIVNVNKE